MKKQGGRNVREFKRKRQGISGTEGIQGREHHVESERGDQVENISQISILRVE